ncbi:MAG: AAA family ATPase [Bacteroidota bacterium]|nr:AAA family ATPase [Bacteroidota bacterium]
MVERRLYLAKLKQLKDQNLIKVITGIRCCGKSTLLEAFMNELIKTQIEREPLAHDRRE